MQNRYLSASVSARMLWLAIGLVLSLGLSAPTIAQAPPPLGPDIIGAVQLTAQQVAVVNSFVDYYTGMLADTKAKPEDVQTARDRLLENLRKPNPSLDFRNTYSKAILNKLVPVLNGQNVHAAVNAIIIISQLGTNRAIDELMGHFDRQLESRWQIRLATASGMASLLQSPTVDPRKVLESIRKISEATKIEDNGVILGHLFGAIAAADSNLFKEQADRKQVREVLVDAVTGVIDRVAKAPNNPHASPLIEPAQAWVGKIRQKYTDPNIRAELQVHGRKLGPALGQLLSVAAAGWDAGHADEDSNKLFTQAIGRCEEFLKEIDKVVRGEGANVPQTKLKDAWVANNKDAFTADLNQWLEVLKQPAYSKP